MRARAHARTHAHRMYKKNKRVYEILREMLELELKHRPEMSFTTIQLGRNLPHFRHRDMHNDGPSLIATFGEFEGGGFEYNGKVLDVHYMNNGRRWKWFDAACEHAACAVTSGTRWSVTVYSDPRCKGAATLEWQEWLKNSEHAGYDARLPPPMLAIEEFLDSKLSPQLSQEVKESAQRQIEFKRRIQQLTNDLYVEEKKASNIKRLKKRVDGRVPDRADKRGQPASADTANDDDDLLPLFAPARRQIGRIEQHATASSAARQRSLGPKIKPRDEMRGDNKAKNKCNEQPVAKSSVPKSSAPASLATLVPDAGSGRQTVLLDWLGINKRK